MCLLVASVGNDISDSPTLHSEDLAYAFGAPLVDGLHPFSSSGFTRTDRIYSELVLRYWTNFIKTGSVRLPQCTSSVTLITGCAVAPALC